MRVSIGDSVRVTISDSVKVTIGDSVRVTISDSVRVTIGDSVRVTIGDSVRVTIGDSESDHWQFGSSLLCSCDVHGVLTNSVCWFLLLLVLILWDSCLFA